jgi:DNA invertase Pin-like site-specific DNA recombinase
VKPSLPRSLDDLRGLRAARWSRESTGRQFDRFGPEAQREQQDRAIERYGLVDTGLSWSVAHSGRTVNRTGEWGAMVDAAGTDYDVLVVGYVSRFARDLRTAVNARHDLHAAGAALLFADERVVSSDEDAWETWAREAVEAEAYSRRLGKRVREGYAAKFRRLSDQGGVAPHGFRRAGEARVLAIDPDTIGDVVHAFERYASGVVSQADLAAELRVPETALREWLANPIYNGWVRRGAERAPAPWRDAPPVSDDLWERVADLRERRAATSGRRTPSGRVDLLRGLLYCGCGQRIRSNGTVRGRQKKSHGGRCEAWGPFVSVDATTWEPWVAAQVAGVRHDAATIARVVAILREPTVRPDTTSRVRVERQMRDLALDVAAGRIDDATYLARIAVLRASASQIDGSGSSTASVSADRAVGYLTSLPFLWRQMTREERAELLAAIYDRIVVTGSGFVRARLTPDAYAHGLALALPETVRCSELAGEEGLSHARSLRIPIEGAAEWRAAARRTA